MINCLPLNSASGPTQPALLIPGLAGRQPRLPEARNAEATSPHVVRVLLLEDNVDLAEMLQMFFDIEGFHTTAAHLGKDALRLLADEQAHFHVAVVDIDLPDTTGFKVVAQAVAQGKLRDTKIIFCSGEWSRERELMAEQFPGSRFLAKPFDMQNLLAQIRNLLKT
jgi:DNA-binding response OmpR family regulator